MKLLKLSLFSITLFFFQDTYGQGSTINLDYNNVNAAVNNRGSLFNRALLGAAGYEAPKGGGNHLIYQGGFWFGGTDQSGVVKLAAHLYGNDYDYYVGPYSTSGDYTNAAYQFKYASSLWYVEKATIDNHINNYNQAGYVVPANILNWPGNGDPALGVANQLAPYVDVDSNGVYEPHLGDYPCIKGDAAVYQIMHEDLAHAQSGGEKIGAEIHIMVYQYLSSNFLNSTTFIETTVYNRGQNSFTDFKASFFLDTDIGFSEDDYIGSAPAKNMMFSYNGTNSDVGQSGVGYGTNPPAVGLVSLNKNVAYSGTFNRPDLGTPMTSDPSAPADYWFYMNGQWKDGTDWTSVGDGYGGTNGSTQHLYDGNPNQGTGWSEVNTDGNGAANAPSDRRILMTVEEEIFQPGDQLVYNYAIITSRTGNNLENVDDLLIYADSVQEFFDSTNTNCAANIILGLSEELQKGKLEIYPNPASNQINIVWEDLRVNQINITSYDGSLVRSISINSVNGEKTIDINGLSSGVYFVNIGNYTRKLIVK